jgi:hypothetical protein
MRSISSFAARFGAAALSAALIYPLLPGGPSKAGGFSCADGLRHPRATGQAHQEQKLTAVGLVNKRESNAITWLTASGAGAVKREWTFFVDAPNRLTLVCSYGNSDVTLVRPLRPGITKCVERFDSSSGRPVPANVICQDTAP